MKAKIKFVLVITVLVLGLAAIPFGNGYADVDCPGTNPAVKAASLTQCPATCIDPAHPSQSIDCTKVTDPALSPGNCGVITQTSQNCDLSLRYIRPGIDFLVALAGVAVVIGIVLGGIEYSSSGGDPQKVARAKGRIRNAIIALLVFIFLAALFSFIIPGGIF